MLTQEIGLAQVLGITAFGLLVATTIVVVLMFCIQLLSKLANHVEANKQPQPEAPPAKPTPVLAPSQTVPTPPTINPTQVSDEEIAAITAVLSHLTGISEQALRIVSINPS